MGYANSVTQDLARAKQAEANAAAGRLHAGAMNSAASDRQIPGVLGAADSTLRGMAQGLTAKADERIAKDVAEKMQDAKEAGKMMTNALAWDRKVKKTQKATKKVADALTKYPSMYNALGDPNREPELNQ